MKPRVGDVMKILIVGLLCLIVLMMGCSNSDSPSLSLWQERQMDDDQRIHGNPYENGRAFGCLPLIEIQL